MLELPGYNYTGFSQSVFRKVGGVISAHSTVEPKCERCSGWVITSLEVPEPDKAESGLKHPMSKRLYHMLSVEVRSA